MHFYLRCYRPELVVTVKVYFPFVRITAEVEGLIAIDSESKDSKKKCTHRAEKQRVELAYHRRRPELKYAMKRS